jgi:riboflavin synthase
LNKTTLRRWDKGTRINLERALKLGDQLGGHIVLGHVDGTAEIVSIKPEGRSRRFEFRPPLVLLPYIAPKGSICLDGTSLTVNEVNGETFGVNLIPHTLAVTTWGFFREGDAVNLEVDMLARYVARLREFE